MNGTGRVALGLVYTIQVVGAVGFVAGLLSFVDVACAATSLVSCHEFCQKKFLPDTGPKFRGHLAQLRLLMIISYYRSVVPSGHLKNNSLQGALRS